MNCEQYLEYISQFIDGELNSIGESDLFRHLAACGQCRIFMKEIMSLRTDILNSQTAAVPESLDRQIIAETNSILHKIHPVTRLVRLFGENRILSLRVIKLALLFSILANVIFLFFWRSTAIKAKPTIVCLTPLPEVEVNGYVVVAPSHTKGIKQ